MTKRMCDFNCGREAEYEIPSHDHAVCSTCKSIVTCIAGADLIDYLKNSFEDGIKLELSNPYDGDWKKIE